MTVRKRIDNTIIIEVYKTQWADIHHSRNQDWELSKLILVGFIGVSGLKAFTEAELLLTILSGSFVLVCILAVLITIRHKRLFAEKMRAIRILEQEMNLIQLRLFTPTSKANLFTTQNFLIVIYILSAIIFGTFFFLQLYS